MIGRREWLVQARALPQRPDISSFDPLVSHQDRFLPRLKLQHRSPLAAGWSSPPESRIIAFDESQTVAQGGHIGSPAPWSEPQDQCRFFHDRRPRLLGVQPVRLHRHTYAEPTAAGRQRRAFHASLFLYSRLLAEPDDLHDG